MAPSRRELLATAGSAVAALAGCTSDLPGSRPGESPGGDRPTATARDPESLSVSGDWPQQGSDSGHDGATGATGVPEDGQAYWHLRRVRSGPAVLADGTLFHYAKLGEETDGRPTLTRTREPDAGTAHPVYGVPGLVARDASDGDIEWTVELPDQGVGWPAVAGGRVVATVRGRLSAHDATDGTADWTVALGEGPVGTPTVAGDAVVVPLHGVVDGSSGEYVHEPAVRAFELSDGGERWTVDAPARGLGVGVAGDAVAVVAHDFDGSGSVQARSLADGSERWRTDLSGEFAFEGPALADDRVYVAGSGGKLHALALSDGGERWSAGRASNGVAAAGDAVYTTHDRHLFARDAADGSVRWSFEVGGESLVAPAVGGVSAGGPSDESNGGVVYVGGSYADLHALDTGDGTERWSASFPRQVVEGDMVRSGLEVQPAIAEGAVYAYAADGLYAFGP